MSLEVAFECLIVVCLLIAGQLVIVLVELFRMRRDVDQLLARVTGPRTRD